MNFSRTQSNTNHILCTETTGTSFGKLCKPFNYSQSLSHSLRHSISHSLNHSSITITHSTAHRTTHLLKRSFKPLLNHPRNQSHNHYITHITTRDQPHEGTKCSRVPHQRGPVCHHIVCTAMKATAHIIEQNNTAFFTLMGELKGANCEDMEEHFSRYNGIALQRLLSRRFV